MCFTYGRIGLRYCGTHFAMERKAGALVLTSLFLNDIDSISKRKKEVIRCRQV